MGTRTHAAGWAGAAALGLGCALFAGGCAVADMAEEAWFQTKQTLRPSAGGYVDDAETVKEDWSEAGRLGRPNQAKVEDDPDWYRKYFMSAKARDIEGNLGFD